jgi:hypothetical protein
LTQSSNWYSFEIGIGKILSKNEIQNIINKVILKKINHQKRGKKISKKPI